MTGSQAFAFSLQVAVIGIGIVFVALIMLVFLFSIMSSITMRAEGAGKKKKASVAEDKPAPPVQAPPVVPAVKVPAEDEDEIAAVIAAVMAFCQNNAGLVVRSVRRAGKNAPVWNLAGRRDNLN